MKIPFPSLSKSFGLLLPLCLVAGCSNDASAGSGDGAASGRGTTTPGGARQLAIKDCAGAAALFGDKLQGLELRDLDGDPVADDVLSCDWTSPQLDRGIQLLVQLGPHLAEDVMPEQAILLGMKRIPAPAFDKLGGQVFSGPIGTSQFIAQLPEAQVMILTTAANGVPPEQYVTDAMRVDVAQKMLGL